MIISSLVIHGGDKHKQVIIVEAKTQYHKEYIRNLTTPFQTLYHKEVIV